MKRWLPIPIIVVAGLFFYPLAAFSVDYGSLTPQMQQTPPVGQKLIREGDFAIKLAAKLDLVTPEIVGQLQSAIAKSSADGKLPINNNEATGGFYLLTQELDQPIPAPEGSTSSEQDQTPTSFTSSAIIDNYYYDQGPPIITYYPPPTDYVYLYDWVPYPVFWFGFWFPLTISATISRPLSLPVSLTMVVTTSTGEGDW